MSEPFQIISQGPAMDHRGISHRDYVVIHTRDFDKANELLARYGDPEVLAALLERLAFPNCHECTALACTKHPQHSQHTYEEVNVDYCPSWQARIAAARLRGET